jgi:hypothetical protein
MEEPSVFANSASTSAHTYRLTWQRSSDPEISVRLDVASDGSGILTAKHLAVDPIRDRVLNSRTVKLSRSSTARFVAQFERSGFWSGPPGPPTFEKSGLDGATLDF